MSTRVGPSGTSSRLRTGWRAVLLPFAVLVAVEIAVVLWSDGDSYNTGIALQWATFAMLAQAFNIIAGYAGRLAFGNIMFFGLTGYVVAAGVVNGWYPAIVGGVIGVVASAVIAYLLSYGLWRVGGLLFALATFAIAEMLRQLAAVFPLIGGSAGLQEPLSTRTSVPDLSLSSQHGFVVVGGILVLLTTVVTLVLERSSLGKRMMAVRDDRVAAGTSGVDAARVTAIGWAISAVISAVAATYYIQHNLFIDPPSAFGLPAITLVVVPAVLGGLGSAWGPVLGSVIIPVGLLLNRLSGSEGIEAVNDLIYGLVLIIVLRLYPAGLTSVLNPVRLWRDRRRAPAGEQPPTADAPASPAPAPVSAPETSGGKRRQMELERPPLLQAREVVKQFGGVRALDGATLHVLRGEILGLLGPNGAGKSTLFNCITGVESITSGEIVFAGEPIARLPAHRRARLGIARTYQTVRLFGRLSVLDNVMVPALSARPPAAARARAEEVLTQTGLARVANAVAGNLTLVEQRRLELARALSSGAQLIMLDEVLTGLSEEEAGELRELILALNREGTTFVMVEHVMGHILPLIDRVVVMDRGKVLAAGEPRAVLEQPAVVAAYFGSQPTSEVVP